MRDPNKVKRYQQNWINNNATKHAAHVILNTALSRGKIVKQPCEVCGTTYRVHGHHDDYSKPLDVRWLCPKHHKEAHGIFRKPKVSIPRKKAATKPRVPKPLAWSHTKKVQLHERAIALHLQGFSYAEIGRKLEISKAHAFKTVNATAYR
jgi:hypothetical protein